jgi:hypothetical protein
VKKKKDLILILSSIILLLSPQFLLIHPISWLIITERQRSKGNKQEERHYDEFDIYFSAAPASASHSCLIFYGAQSD